MFCIPEAHSKQASFFCAFREAKRAKKGKREKQAGHPTTVFLAKKLILLILQFFKQRD
jgi:hypothetical protein